MDWDPAQVRTASYKGVEFRCVLSVNYRDGKRHRLVGYPNRPGQLAWDGARRGAAIELTALFMDDEYPGTMNDLIEACASVGPGTLVHPTRGEINALAIEWSDDIQGTEPNKAQLKLSFVEVALNEQAWKRVIEIMNPEARAQTLASSLDSALGYSGSASFTAHATTFLAVLAMPSLTTDLLNQALATAVQSIRALADAIDTATNPLYFDYIAEAYVLAGYCIEAVDLYAGNQTTLSLFLVRREMTLLDVAAETGASEDDILRYNVIGDPLAIAAGTYLIVP